MKKKKFETKQNFIDFLWDSKGWRVSPSMSPVDKRSDLANYLGVEFKSLYDITGKDEDDGKWAGKNHYDWCKWRGLPKKFPCIMVLEIFQIKYTFSYDVEYIYESDFK